MCLSNEAFALFLNMIGTGIFTIEGTTVTVHATEGDVTWHEVVDEWCTAAPYTEARLPFTTAPLKQPFTMR
ncbi:hypothetical protein PVV74_05350 [Roseovarius sp. SK2]|uniref:hypothetical protein n=1 Tax=Roseovarius TaxID=74030 RepID=UPI00237C2327|nr:hypothetical protein [Roseovarius sp. SK2]MDD9724871.1 hypothetical protein [Roseovarius sp. SK2]